MDIYNESIFRSCEIGDSMKFSKYHGCGNDFIMGVYEDNIDYSSLAIKICDRHTGIGADGLILAKGSRPIEMVFYNADGSRGLMCGNGIRCLSKFILDNNLDKLEDGKLEISTLSGLRTVYVNNGLFKVNMGKPSFKAKDVGINKNGEFHNELIQYKEKNFNCSSCFMTVDHLVVMVDNFNITDDEASYLCNNPIFTRKINVNFVNIIDRNNIRVKTFERGVGWTLACGSGSSASFALLNKDGLINNSVNVILERGKLKISIDSNKDIFMEGPAETISSNVEYNI